MPPPRAQEGVFIRCGQNFVTADGLFAFTQKGKNIRMLTAVIHAACYQNGTAERRVDAEDFRIDDIAHDIPHE